MSRSVFGRVNLIGLEVRDYLNKETLGGHYERLDHDA